MKLIRLAIIAALLITLILTLAIYPTAPGPYRIALERCRPG